MQRWEYLTAVFNRRAGEWDVEPLGTFGNQEDYFKAAGQAGWELVSVTPETDRYHECHYFKRPIAVAEPVPEPAATVLADLADQLKRDLTGA